MYTGSLDAVANNETWELTISCTDTDSGELIDFTGCLVEMELKDQNGGRCLSASTDDGGIILNEPTALTLTIDMDRMRTFCAGTYLIGIRASRDGRYASLAACTLPIIEGNT